MYKTILWLKSWDFLGIQDYHHVEMCSVVIYFIHLMVAMVTTLELPRIWNIGSYMYVNQYPHLLELEYPFYNNDQTLWHISHSRG